MQAGRRERRKEARRGTGMGSSSCVKTCSQLNFKQTIVHLLNGVPGDEITFRASMNQFSPVNGKKQIIKSRINLLGQFHKPNVNLEKHHV